MYGLIYCSHSVNSIKRIYFEVKQLCYYLVWSGQPGVLQKQQVNFYSIFCHASESLEKNLWIPKYVHQCLVEKGLWDRRTLFGQLEQAWAKGSLFDLVPTVLLPRLFKIYMMSWVPTLVPDEYLSPIATSWSLISQPSIVKGFDQHIQEEFILVQQLLVLCLRSRRSSWSSQYVSGRMAKRVQIQNPR